MQYHDHSIDSCCGNNVLMRLIIIIELLANDHQNMWLVIVVTMKGFKLSEPITFNTCLFNTWYTQSDHR